MLPHKFFESKTKVTLALLLPAFILYFKSIHFGFTTLDEQWMIEQNEALKHTRQSLKDAFTSSISGTYYRPLLMLSILLDYGIGRTSPHIYHFTNLILHLGAVLLLFRFLRLNKVSEQGAFVYSLIFSVHPVMLHAVAWIPGRNDSLLCIFTLASLIALLRFFAAPGKKYLVFHFLFFILALLTKESAVVLPLIFASYYALYKQPRSDSYRTREFFWFLAGWAGIGIAWFLVRSTTVFIAPGDVFFSLSALREFVPAMLLYIGKAVLPVQQSVLPMLRDASLVPGLLVVALLALLLFKPGTGNKRLAGIGLLLFFMLLVIPVWFSVAKTGAEHYEHRIYTSMAGLVLFFSQLKFDTGSRNFYYAAGLVFVLFAWRSYTRMDVYKNKNLFLIAGVQESPGFYLFHFQRGELLYQQQKYDSALIYYNKAIAIRPDKAQMYSNRGAALYSKGMYSQAISDFSKAISLSTGPTIDNRYYLNRCVVYTRCNQLEQAMKDFMYLKQHEPSLIPQYLEKELTDKWALLMAGLTARIMADQGNHRLLYKRARFLFLTGWEKEGLADMEAVLSRAPDNAEYQQVYKEHLKNQVNWSGKSEKN
jgi:tetratricopeptide (TPR) repeat protein